MSQTKCRYAVVANFSIDSYFKLEREPGLRSAFSKTNETVSWISLYGFARNTELYGLESSGELFFSELQHVEIALIHKELVEFVPLSAFRKLSESGVLIVGFLGDEEWALEHTANFLPIFDVVVVYSKIAFEEYSSLGYDVLRLPVGGSFMNAGLLTSSVKEDIDVLFIGRPYTPRPEIVNYLIDHGISVSVYGSERWKRLIPAENYCGFLKNEDYNSTLLRAKIVLGLMEAPNNGPTHINAKVFDGCKAGKLVICSHYPPFYSDYALVEDKSIVTYSSMEELLDKISLYLESSEKRLAIASAMRQEIIRNFDYSVLYRNLLDKIEARYSAKLLRERDDLVVEGKYGVPEDFDWFLLCPSDHVYFEPIVIEVCKIGSQFNISQMVVNSVYKDRLIRKRLPIVDAKSVLVRKGSAKPLTLFGLAWCLNATRCPYYALNTYEKGSVAMYAVAFLESCLEWVLNRVRGTHKV